MASLLPEAGGKKLPYWLLFMSSLAAFNTAQTYLAPKDRPWPTLQTLYANSPITPLQARTMGTWTSISAVARVLCAYNVNSKPIFQLTMFTFGAAAVHFALEWCWFGTMTTGSFLQSGGFVDGLTAGYMAFGLGRGWYC